MNRVLYRLAVDEQGRRLELLKDMVRYMARRCEPDTPEAFYWKERKGPS